MVERSGPFVSLLESAVTFEIVPETKSRALADLEENNGSALAFSCK